jgi:hypothetical protein
MKWNLIKLNQGWTRKQVNPTEPTQLSEKGSVIKE